MKQQWEGQAPPLPAKIQSPGQVSTGVWDEKTGPPLEGWAGEDGVKLDWLARGMEQELQPGRTSNGQLERELQSQLDQARVVHGGIHRAEAECVSIADRRPELRVVE